MQVLSGLPTVDETAYPDQWEGEEPRGEAQEEAEEVHAVVAQDQDLAFVVVIGALGREEAEGKVAAEAWRRGERVQEQQGAEERGAGRRPRKGEPDRGAGGEGEPAREEDQEALVQGVNIICQVCSVTTPPSEQDGQVEHAAGEGVDVQVAPQLASDISI